MLIVAVIICTILYNLYSAAGYLALFVLICTRGIVSIIAVAQSSLIRCILNEV